MAIPVVTIVCCAVIFVLSVIATLAPDVFSFIHRIPFGDKLAHFVLFGVSAWLNVVFGSKKQRILGFILLLVFATADEFMQLTNATRTFSWFDLVADLAGILIFSILALYYLSRRK